MCEFQRWDPHDGKKPPICIYTKQRCTFCIMGNSHTYYNAKLEQEYPHKFKDGGDNNG